MRSFQFNNKRADNDIEKVIKYRNRKNTTQQIIYASIFAIVVAMIGVYVYGKMMYTEFDGYVKIDLRKHRAPEDMLVKNIYVREGDFVIPGDTLYSYVYLKTILDQLNPNAEPDIVIRDRDMRLKYAELLEEIQVLRVKVRDLERQIGVEDHNISFGLSDNSHKLDLQRELNAAREELRMKLSGLYVAHQTKKSLEEGVRKSSYDANLSMSLQDIVNDSNSRFEPLLLYHTATDSSIVSYIGTTGGACVFHSEEIVSLQPIDPDKSNFSVFVYLAEDKVGRIRRDCNVEVFFSDEISAKARFGYIGLRTEELPEHLKSNFMRQGKVLIAKVNVLDNQELPFWTFTDNLPVRIRMPNLNRWWYRSDMSGAARIWIRTGRGVPKNSKEFLKQNRDSTLQQQRKRMRRD